MDLFSSPPQIPFAVLYPAEVTLFGYVAALTPPPATGRFTGESPVMFDGVLKVTFKTTIPTTIVPVLPVVDSFHPVDLSTSHVPKVIFPVSPQSGHGVSFVLVAIVISSSTLTCGGNKAFKFADCIASIALVILLISVAFT